MGNPANLTTGPGTLWVADYGATLPTARNTALGSGWVSIGYTEEGNAFTMERTLEGMYVAEERRAVKQYVTEIKEMVVFSMAEATNINLTLALNGGLIQSTDPGYDEEAAITAPTVGNEQRISIVFDADSGARWVYKKCINNGSTELARRKAPEKTLIPVEFMLEIPNDNSATWVVYPNASGVI